MRALIDTCVIVDALQSRDPFCADAQKIFLAVANRWFDGCITAKSSADIYYLAHRTTHSDTETRKILAKLFALFDLLDTTAMDCRRTLSSKMTDYEDAVMAETALRSGCNCIVTRNLKDYKNASIPSYSPSDFLQLITPTEE